MNWGSYLRQDEIVMKTPGAISPYMIGLFVLSSKIYLNKQLD